MKHIANKLNISIEIPSGQSFELIKIRNENTSSKGSILFNIKPVFHFNIIHFTLFGYIKTFTDAGYHCTIVLQDLITANGGFLDEINTPDEAKGAMDLFYERASKFSIDTSKLEIIPETGLIRLYNRDKRRFLFDLIKISSLADRHFGKIQINSFDHIDSLCCFLYEAFLKPDYVITGGSELNTVWKDLRKRSNLNKIFGESYVSPIMLIVPNIYKHDDKKLISTLDKYDPFSEDYDNFDTSEFIEEYSSHILNLNSNIHFQGSGDIAEIINSFKELMYSTK